MKSPLWRCHTPNLLKEVIGNSGTAILSIPLNIMGKLLAQVGERAAELNDPKLNRLMMQLTIYAAADPESPDYNQALVDEYLGANRVI